MHQTKPSISVLDISDAPLVFPTFASVPYELTNLDSASSIEIGPVMNDAMVPVVRLLPGQSVRLDFNDDVRNGGVRGRAQTNKVKLKIMPLRCG